MTHKIKTAILILATGLITLGAPALSLANASACSDVKGNVNQGVNAAFGASGEGSGSGANCSVVSNSGSNSIAQIAKTAVNILSLIVGIVAVIMIIYGGLRYITSGGDSNSVGGAKNTLIYAIIGLIIVALAQVIVHFVLNAALQGTVGTS